MKLDLNSQTLNVSFACRIEDAWVPVPETACTQSGFDWTLNGAHYSAQFTPAGDTLCYTLQMDAPNPTQLRMWLAVPGQSDYFHVIPCNIYGDNHAEEAKPGEFPMLTQAHHEVAFCAPLWEFRADRAAMPLSALCWNDGVAAVAVEPYSQSEAGTIRNGVFAALPDAFGVSLGYTNDPVTFKNRSTAAPSTRNMACKAQTSGTIYLRHGPRTELHEIIRQEYARHHDRAAPHNTLRQAVQGMLEAFAYQNYDAAAGEYTNRCCRPPKDTEMKPWRLVTEIGWTGGGVLAYPLVLCRDALGAAADAPLAAAMSGEQLFDRIADAYNENSGLLNDLMVPNAAGSQVNGWWTGYGLVKDCHCAYTVGSAVHYLTKTMDYLHQNGKPCPAKWMDAAQKVLHTVMDLQRADGAFGYTYSTQERKVLDWSGFAGCWFAPALVYLYRLTGEERCLHSAEKALDYYHTFVKDLNCYGTPMDTWKAVDEEGNLAFMRGSRLLYEQTGKAEFLQYMKDSAGYEFLWRYGYKTYPEHTPLNQGWSACGGAVTSVSNPHIHPMGVIIDTDLRYLARVTGDGYYASRAADSAAWMLQCLELYPAATGYGRYGILSERWCPSDGLDVERFSDGRPFSSWFSHNLWASACVLEAACELLLEIEHKKG